MKEINNLLINLKLKPLSYEKNNNVYIINTKDGKYVIKKTNKEIYKYLGKRDYNNIVDYIYLDDYIIYNYLNEEMIPKEQKILDLIYLVSLLHKKTSYYKNITENEIKEIYENINNNISFLKIYYDTMMTSIESREIMNPSEYYLARNISLFYKSIDESYKYINNWYKELKEATSYRVCLIHNNLKVDHLINNRLISFEKAKIDIPIYDLYKLYKETYDYNDFYDLYLKYNKEFTLSKEEENLFFSLICLPNKIEFNTNEYDNTLKVTKEVAYLNNVNNFINKINLPKNKESK